MLKRTYLTEEQIVDIKDLLNNDFVTSAYVIDKYKAILKKSKKIKF
jgi:hypothetical protein